MKISQRTIERGRAIIEEGKGLLTWIDKRGNIDAHDLWYNKAAKFLAVNCPDYEKKLGQVAPKYKPRILAKHNSRAVYEMLYEQNEVFTDCIGHLGG